jgi:hypothetical protein
VQNHASLGGSERGPVEGNGARNNKSRSIRIWRERDAIKDKASGRRPHSAGNPLSFALAPNRGERDF